MRQAIMLTAMLLVLGAAVVPTGALAEQCVRFESEPATVSFNLTSENMMRGISPVSYCELVPGRKYGMLVESRGYETRSFKFKLNGDNTMDVSGNRLNYLSRSVVLPGWGQWRLDQTNAGAWALGLTIGSLIYLGNAGYDYYQAKDELDALEAELKKAETVDEIEALSELSLSQSNAADAQQQYLIEVGAFTGYIYLNNLVETWLWATPPSSNVEGNTVRIGTPRKTNTRATIRSAFFPGLGQKYVGSEFKGYIFQSMFLIAGVGVLESRRDYREARDRYDVSLLALAEAEDIGGLDAARSQSQAAWDQVLRKERHRNAWYIAAGSVWLINVLDAAFSKKLAKEAPGFFETSMSGKTIRTGINVRF